MEVPGPISRQAARAAGFTDRELRGRTFHRVRHGQYIRADVVDGLDEVARHRLSVRAAAASASPQAVVSHVSAAIMHGLPVWGISLRQVHMTRDRPRGGRVRSGLVVHSGRIAPDEVATVDGVQVTSVARTVIDVARTVSFERAVVVGDAALHPNMTSETELAAQLTRAARRAGCPEARRVVEFLDGRSESVGESRSRVCLRDSGLARPQLQANIRGEDGSWLARVDFLWPALGVVGEFDGMEKYRSEKLRGERSVQDVVLVEKSRENALRALGLLVFRWTWRDLDAPQDWLPRLRRIAEMPRQPGPWRWDP